MTGSTPGTASGRDGVSLPVDKRARSPDISTVIISPEVAVTIPPTCQLPKIAPAAPERLSPGTSQVKLAEKVWKMLFPERPRSREKSSI